VAAPDDDRWLAGLRAVIADPSLVTPAVQPIVDLHRGTVVGHEALSRFAGPPDATPDRWFAAAERLELGPELTAATLTRAFGLLDRLPPNTFLTVNLEPHHVRTAPVQRVLAAPGRLDRVVLELTEHVALDDPASLRAELDRLRTLGATIAVDDAGSGYAGLQALLQLRPQLIKLDRALVDGLDRDPAKRVLLRAVGDLADGIDAWVLGEGIETDGELAVLVAEQVPLGQGYRLGRPGPELVSEVAIDVLRAIRTAVQQRSLEELVASAITPATTEDVGPLATRSPAASTPGSGGPAPAAATVGVDGWRRPIWLRTEDGTVVRTLLKAKPSDLLVEVARRVAARADGRWHDPVVVTDGQGAFAGLVPVATLLERLARTPRPSA
jgi:EAL domain-containing protein (putative c-di-GMP-specific phosphodiesterase class I)